MNNAAQNLAYVSIVERWAAIHDALASGDKWHEKLRRSVAYTYWANRFNYRFHLHALTEFDEGRRPQKLRMLNFGRDFGPSVGACLALGFVDWAVHAARMTFEALRNGLLFDGGDDFGQRRTQHFVLRLVADWQGWTGAEQPSCAYDEPIFNALIERWRTPDVTDLTPSLLAACDRHTRESRYDNSKGAFFDLPNDFWYWPFEIMSIFRLRQLAGLENPDINHPIMDTPLARLFPISPSYHEPLLDGVVARARIEFPDL